VVWRLKAGTVRGKAVQRHVTVLWGWEVGLEKIDEVLEKFGQEHRNVGKSDSVR